MMKPEDQSNLLVGYLLLDVMEGAALPAADITRTSDPYVKATLTGRWSHEMEWPESMRITQKTAYKHLTLNPEWYESFIFPVRRGEGAILRLEVFDKDQSSADDFLGSVEVPLEALLGGRPLDTWLILDLAKKFKVKRNSDTARIRIAARYHFSAFNHLASMTWKEKEYEYVPSKFSLDRTVTEIFVTLEMLVSTTANVANT